jgi:hypothetical protein
VQGPYNCLTILLLRFWRGILRAPQNAPTDRARLQCRGVCPSAGVLTEEGVANNSGYWCKHGVRGNYAPLTKGIRGLVVQLSRMPVGPPPDLPRNANEMKL